jgi:hypothetical protein
MDVDHSVTHFDDLKKLYATSTLGRCTTKNPVLTE